MVTLKRWFLSVLVGAVVLANGAFMLPAGAQAGITLTLNIPEFWRDTISPEMIAEFEAQNPGINVHIEYGDTVGGRFGGAGLDLEEVEEYVSSGDVLYVDNSLLTAGSTYAGFYLDLAPLVASDSGLAAEDFYPALWQSFQWDGGVWGLPVSTDVTLVIYDELAFDAAGLAYPNGSWTLDDFANAARALAETDASGSILTPGMSTGFSGDNLGLLFRSLLGAGLYDNAAFPNTPQLTDPLLESMLTTWRALEEEGVVTSGFTENFSEIPLSINASFALNVRGPNATSESSVPSAALLPGNTAGLNVQGFAISGGTRYPDEAYALAKFLSDRPEVANNFLGTVPARQSLAGSQSTQGPGGGPGFRRATNPEIQAVINEAVAVALPLSELRFASYLSTALDNMRTNAVDARTALQEAEAQALSDMQSAIDYGATANITVAEPPPPPQLSPGQVTLNFGLASNFRIAGGGLPGQEEWDRLIEAFVAGDPQVGQVAMEPAQGNNLTALAEQYDCFILPNNAVPGSDLSGLLNLDPFMDADPNFDRNDIIGNTLAQLQEDGKTWAVPLALQPQVLRYDPDLFAAAGVPLPENGWTTDAFINALQMLKGITGDAAPFIPQDPTGTHLMVLIAAFGGVPINYNTSPPTINFTDPATVDAIRQVLDLAKAGYLEYNELGGQAFVVFTNTNEPPAITTDSLNPFGFSGFNNAQNETRLTTYPSGSTGNVVSYEIATGYVSASAENPEACYRFLSEVSRQAHVFSAMPVRSSLVNDPAMTASQGADIVNLYNQFDALMSDPNTVVIPSSFRQGGSPADFLVRLWLGRAFDRYVLEDADLEFELQEAEVITRDFLECVANLPPADPNTQQGPGGGRFGEIQECAASADPNFSF